MTRDPRHDRPARPTPRKPGQRRRAFRRGHENPRGVVWFGLRSFWGHLRHFIASAIATEDVDSRDWMTPDLPEDLLRRVAGILGGDPHAPSLVQSLDREVWIDYVADTGDDTAVSRAVARLIFAEYELPDPQRDGETLVAPRGDILCFGGDTAYPVATAEEITNRVLVPFNQVLAEQDDDRERVLLGIPGNHDWYDGLDGFGRLFRRREDEAAARPSMVGIWRRPLERYADFAKELVRGGQVHKPHVLALSGYTPVQSASYFALPIAPLVQLLALDRQLKHLDTRQRQFFADQRLDQPNASVWLMLPDPVYAFGRPSRTGVGMVTALGLDLDAAPSFVLSGDIHHYERLHEGTTIHVTAGGGGAFLHPAGMGSGQRVEPTVCWPDVDDCKPLLYLVPLKVALGRSGLIPHLLLIAAYALSVSVARYAGAATLLAVIAVFTLLTTPILAMIGGARQGNRGRVIALAMLASLVMSVIPLGVGRLAIHWIGHPLVGVPATLLLSSVIGAGVFGAFLAYLTRAGLEQTQAFTALDHPGFKHFLRIRARPDGTLDVWCIGKTDPLGEDREICLVDAFTWRPVDSDSLAPPGKTRSGDAVS